MHVSMALGVRHIQIPVTDEEYEEIYKLKGRDQSWRDYGLPRLRIADLKKK
jgi:hypothetical protein